MATISTLAMSISPIGNFIGGIFGEFFDARTIILVSGIVALLVVCLIIINPKVKAFLNTEIE